MEEIRLKMETEVSKLGNDLELASIYPSKGKYVGVIGYKDPTRESDAYEEVLVYDPDKRSIDRIHFMTALLEFPEEK